MDTRETASSSIPARAVSFFFFSSRRRHTRLQGDWSSDVCSSDLLYRDRFRFAVEPASVALGQPQFPKGQIHEDKFFGKQETYRKEVRIRLPVEAGGAERLKLQVTDRKSVV